MRANYVLTQEVGKHMIARGKGGKVLNVSSLAGMIATKNISVYAGTKGAVNQFTSAFANEWAEHNIQVNCVCPGYVPKKKEKTTLIIPTSVLSQTC
jgi:short-subunit dehydrogenase